MIPPLDRVVRTRALRGTLCLLAVASLAAACSTMNPPAAAPDPGAIARLEAEASRSPSDPLLLRELGSAYHAADRPQDARLVLERALEMDGDDAPVVLLLGVVYEELELYAEARRLYDHYLAVGSSRAVKARVRSRIPLVERLAFRKEIRDGVAREAAFAGATPDPRNVAVFPFIYQGTNVELQSLGRALAELLTTDLAQTDRITVLERAKAQILIDELQLGESGALDPATAARGGRLLGAGRVVQGRIADVGDEIRLEAAVVGVAEGVSSRALGEQDQLRALFDLEKRIALGIYDALGVQLTAAERERVNRRPTESVQALLAFGFGLLAEDAGDYGQAATHFARAGELDAGFDIAKSRGTANQQIANTTMLTTKELGNLAAAEAQQALPGIDAIQALVPPVSGRDAGAEILGNEGVGRPLILEIILQRPQ